MDLLNSLQKLALSDNKKAPEQQQHHDAPAPAAAPKHENVFDKLSDKLGGSHATPAPPPVATPAPAPKHESVFDKIGDALSGSHAHSTTPPAPSVATPAAAAPAHESVLGKIGSALSGLQHHTGAPHEAAAQAPKKDDGLLGKLGDAISGRKTPPPPPKEQNLLDKLTHVISGKDEQPAKPQGLADKINYALGGGAKGEQNEDKLDKAIDLFQEHVLKEGPQNNESAIEQAKDKKIADTIRHTLGRDKPE
ncbi:hypothetical protein BDN70DRAFT_804514 [Pholiota conissans]|uniref:Uncharacterized protein n=1 Tax=Pholiota conissans TaxID=109636 RepID=A0A9P5Z3K6_9AGAR|nr:hypothetical protein BDN70DRAFT_804514 [Pholiota conissans]